MTKNERIRLLEIQVEALQQQVKELQASGRWWNAQPNPITYPGYGPQQSASTYTLVNNKSYGGMSLSWDELSN